MAETQTSPLNIGSLCTDEDRLSCLPKKLRDAAPSIEPNSKSGQWLYRAAEPFYTKEGIAGVQTALEEGEISSGTAYAEKLSQKIKDYFDVPVALPVSSGATALIVTMMCCDIGPGDQVICPSLTFVAVGNGVSICGAKPVYADNAPGTLNPSWAEIEAKATPKTKAVIVCHTYGVVIKDIKLIAEKCRERGWILIEDICEALGTRTEEGKLVGTYGDFACASLYANKIITAGDGGWVHTKEQKYHDRLKSLINHGFVPGRRFFHFEVAPNAKMSGLGATLACASMDHLNVLIRHRQSLARTYRQHLESLEPQLTCMEKGNEDAPWVFGVELQSREIKDAFREHLAMHDIETRNYFVCLHLQPFNFLSATGSYEMPLPVSESKAATGTSLPTHAYMNSEDVKYVCCVVQNFFDRSVDIPASPREVGWAQQVRLDWTPASVDQF